MSLQTHLGLKLENVEVLRLAELLSRDGALTPEVIDRLRNLDRLLTQRMADLHSTNVQLKNEIAAQARLENQLRQSQKMEALGQLAGGVAHDFNNILTVIQGNASLLLSGKSPDSPDLQLLNKICSAADGAAEMVDRLQTFCRKQVVDLRPVHLQETVAAVVENLPGDAHPAIKLDTHVPTDLPAVNADGRMLETVIMNLALNARDAMPEGGILCIAAVPVTLRPDDVASNPDARPGSFVRLTVSDTGAGIAPEIMPRIFEPFFTTKPSGRGAGLGLAIVFGIVKQHKGWIEVQSKVQRGAAFHVYLPLMKSVETTPATPVAEPVKPARKTARETIFVVDDEPDLRELVTQILESGGYHVVSAGCGAEALEIWGRRPGPIHLLLTDIVMPDGFTGRKLADKLQGEEPNLRVIYSSGYTAGMPGTELSNMDERCFLAKPYRPATLLKVVRDCLDAPVSNPARTAQAAA